MESQGNAVVNPLPFYPSLKEGYEFDATFLGGDDKNFVYVRKFSSETDYMLIQEAFDVRALLYATPDQPIPPEEIAEGMYVLIRDQGTYFRGKIVNKKMPTNFIRCLKIDAGVNWIGLPSQVFRLPPEFFTIPQTAIPCRLVGLELFNDLPHLELAYNLLKMGDMVATPVYKVRVQSFTDGNVNVAMYRRDTGASLTNEVQKYIPKLCQPPLPPFNARSDAEFFYVRDNGMIWFRTLNDDWGMDVLYNRIKEKLASCRKKETVEVSKSTPRNQYEIKKKVVLPRSKLAEDPEKLKPKSNVAKPNIPEVDIWKQSYLSFPTGIFAFEDNGAVFRVRVLRVVKLETVEIELIDLGSRRRVPQSCLIPLEDIDLNLALIPPLVHVGRLYGFYRVESPVIWSYFPIPSKPCGEIVVKRWRGLRKEKSPSPVQMEVEIFTTENKDESINQEIANVEDPNYFIVIPGELDCEGGDNVQQWGYLIDYWERSNNADNSDGTFWMKKAIIVREEDVCDMDGITEE